MAELSSIVDIEIRTKTAVAESKKLVDNLQKINKAQGTVKKSSKDMEKSLDGSSKVIQKPSSVLYYQVSPSPMDFPYSSWEVFPTAVMPEPLWRLV